MEISRLAVLLFVILGFLVTGCRADGTLTALIVSSCISGLLILLAILGGIVYCVIRYQKKQDVLPKTPGPLINGHYRPMGAGDPHVSPGERAKAFTQHSVVPRHRPPLNFYSVRADPRDVGLGAPPRAFPPGAPIVTAPPNFGRPVLYLDMLDTVVGPKSNGIGPRNANGNIDGHLVRDAEDADERELLEDRYRRKEHKKSRGRSKSLSREESTPSHHERSRSRSRDARTLESASRRKSRKSQQPMEETPILAVPGDIILADSNMPRQSVPLSHGPVERSFSHHRMEDPTGGFITTTLQQRHYTMTLDNDTEQEYDHLHRSDIYFLPSSRSEDPFHTPPLRETNATHFIPVSDLPRRPSTSESESEPEPTPRADYFGSAGLPRASHPPVLGKQGSESDAEPTPAPDYSAIPVVNTETQVYSYNEVRQTYPAGTTSVMEGADSRAFDAILSSVNLHSEAARRQRPPTPPFDGETSPRDSLTFSPPSPASLGQLDSEVVRIPSPPPDIPSPEEEEEEDDVDTGGRFAAILAARPPTPPPGKLLRPKEEELSVLQDFQDEGSKLRSSSHPNLPALPFMAELKRRQRDTDDREEEKEHPPPLPPLPIPSSLPGSAQQERGENFSRGFDAVLSPEAPSAARAQVVSFTAAPPEIIPNDDPLTPHDHHSQEDDNQPSTSAFAPPTSSPPSPPLPPPLPPMSKRF